MSRQLDANKTGWPDNFAGHFKSFEDFKAWYDLKYKNLKAEEVWKKIGGKLPEKKKKEE